MAAAQLSSLSLALEKQNWTLQYDRSIASMPQMPHAPSTSPKTLNTLLKGKCLRQNQDCTNPTAESLKFANSLAAVEGEK